MSAVIALPLAERPLRILNPQLSQKLHAINEARDALRALGLRVERQDVRIGTDRLPRLTVAPSKRTRLLLAETQVEEIGGKRLLVGRFMGVEIAWPMGLLS